MGILSAAHVHTDVYAGLLANHDAVSFVGVTDEDDKRGLEMAERHGTTYVEDAEDLLEQIDAAVICSPNVAHREWVERAIEYDVHILCEKPLAATPENARAIVDQWRESNVLMGITMPLRFCGPALRARRCLDSDGIGSIRSISGTNRGKMPGGWFADPALSGGGAVMDHTVHIVDLVHSLTGEEVTEVYAEIDTRFHDIPVDDLNVLSMELSDGTPFLLDGSWSKPDSWHTWGDASLELVGENGVISIDYTDQSLVHTSVSGTDTGVNTVFYGTDADAGLINNFVESIQWNRDPKITPTEGLKLVAVIEAAYESAERGEPVAVEY